MYTIADPTSRTESHRAQASRTIEEFERSRIAVFPSGYRRKGSYVEDWPNVPMAEAIAITRHDLSEKIVNLAGRTGDGVAVIDLDAKNGVDPTDMLQLLRGLVGPAIIAIVRTSRGFHIWVRVTGPVGNGFCSFVGGEIFSEPHLAMLPPSAHPSGAQYAWELEPREPEAAVNLRALGLVPDKPATSVRASTPCTPATDDVQREFAALMAAAGVAQVGARSQFLTLCPWHDDRSPSLSINWRSAVFYCFSPSCGVRGGIKSLKRLVQGDTPSYRHEPVDGRAPSRQRQQDHSFGDKSGCFDGDATLERIATGLETVGLDDRASAMRSCRKFFSVAKCTSCARTPAFPISCSDPLCVRCMPGRLAADWLRHRSSFPTSMTLIRLRPRDMAPGSDGVLKKARSRFSDWRRRAGVVSGIYGARLDADVGAIVLLAVPSELPLPEPSRAFDVELVAVDQPPDQVLSWLQREYVEEASSWQSGAELEFLIKETKGRRRYQGFGKAYGEGEKNDDRECKERTKMANGEEAESGNVRRPLGRISGGENSGKRSQHKLACSFCGGEVELYNFTVPASEVTKMGNGWLWNGSSAGPPEGRHYRDDRRSM